MRAASEDDDDRFMLYFSSIPCSFEKVDGTFEPFVVCSHDESSFDAVLARGRETGASIVVPAIPALDFKQRFTANVPVVAALEKPLLKSASGVIRGWKSGVRSALLRQGPKVYRLKGCGNDDSGFVVRKNKGWSDIRGCAFRDTAVRECQMAAALGGANIPCGVWRYDSLIMGVQPCCIVEETLGDRRFGTHVLAGLELLLPHLVRKLPAKVAELAPPTRPLYDASGGVFSTGEIMMDVALGGLAFPGLSVPGCLANLKDSTSLPIAAPPSDWLPDQWTRSGAAPMRPAWQKLWRSRCEALKHGLDVVLPYLYSRCGFEGFQFVFFSFFCVFGLAFCDLVFFLAGRILKAMHETGFSWGTYQDQMCNRLLDEWHCNAHCKAKISCLSLSEIFGKPTILWSFRLLLPCCPLLILTWLFLEMRL